MKNRLSLILPFTALLTACGSDKSDPEPDVLMFAAQETQQSGYEPWVTDGTEIGTFKLKEINDAEDSNPQWPVRLNGQWLFAADDGVNGLELWVSNGTEAGTKLLKDLNPSGSADVRYMTTFKGKVYFSANDGVNGDEIWVTDGTQAGTYMFKDLQTGANGSYPFGFTVAGGYLYFTATIDDSRMLLATNGGNEEGDTAIVTTSNDVEFGLPNALTAYRNGVIFTASSFEYGYEPYFVEGRTAKRIADINPGIGSGYPSKFQVINDKVVFVANDNIHGAELWVYDGVNAPQLLNDLSLGDKATSFKRFMVFKDKLFFTATVEDPERADSGPYELFATTGNLDDVVLIKGGLTSNQFDLLGSNKEHLFLMGKYAGKRYLWVSKGDTGSTMPLTVTDLSDLSPVASVVNDMLIFVGGSESYGFEPWVSNGTADSTKLLKDINLDAGSSFPEIKLRGLSPGY